MRKNTGLCTVQTELANPQVSNFKGIAEGKLNGAEHALADVVLQVSKTTSVTITRTISSTITASVTTSKLSPPPSRSCHHHHHHHHHQQGGHPREIVAHELLSMVMVEVLRY
jgi:hypothetical protein